MNPRPLSSSFLGLPFWILNMNHKKELLRGLWVVPKLGGLLKPSQQSYDDLLRALSRRCRISQCSIVGPTLRFRVA